MTQTTKPETPEVKTDKKTKVAPKATPQVATNPASQKRTPVKKEKLPWGGILETY